MAHCTSIWKSTQGQQKMLQYSTELRTAADFPARVRWYSLPRKGMLTTTCFHMVQLNGQTRFMIYGSTRFRRGLTGASLYITLPQ